MICFVNGSSTIIGFNFGHYYVSRMWLISYIVITKRLDWRGYVSQTYGHFISFTSRLILLLGDGILQH